MIDPANVPNVGQTNSWPLPERPSVARQCRPTLGLAAQPRWGS